MITQKQILRTAPEKYDALKERVIYSHSICELLHSLLGMQDELGEFSKCLRKSLLYNQNFDIENAKEELGDLGWFFTLACKALGTTYEEVMKQNYEKLLIRYPEKFTEELAEERLDKKVHCRLCSSSEHTLEECPEDTGEISDRARI